MSAVTRKLRIGVWGVCEVEYEKKINMKKNNFGNFNTKVVFR